MDKDGHDDHEEENARGIAAALEPLEHLDKAAEPQQLEQLEDADPAEQLLVSPPSSTSSCAPNGLRPCPTAMQRKMISHGIEPITSIGSRFFA